MKTAIITGIAGQDGAFLAKLLLEKGYHVIGADRRRVDTDYWRLMDLKIRDGVEFVYFDLLEESGIHALIRDRTPDEFYNLAAQSFVKASWDLPLLTSKVNSLGVVSILEAIRLWSPKTRFYQASTSEMFGKIQEGKQSETTKLYPRSPYGVSKVFAHYMTINYRESFGLFAVSGILFNHESEYRGKEFVTKKITNYVANRFLGKIDTPLQLGNLDAKRDWGYAGDYVEGMWKMLQMDKADDYVLASGETHSVKDFLKAAFGNVGIHLTFKGSGINERAFNSADNSLLVEVNEAFYRPAEVDILLGDPSKAKLDLGWSSKTSFNDLVSKMVNFDIAKLG